MPQFFCLGINEMQSWTLSLSSKASSRGQLVPAFSIAEPGVRTSAPPRFSIGVFPGVSERSNRYASSESHTIRGLHEKHTVAWCAVFRRLVDDFRLHYGCDNGAHLSANRRDIRPH